MLYKLHQFDPSLALAEKDDPSRNPQLTFYSERKNELTGNFQTAIRRYKVSMKVQGLSNWWRSEIIRCIILEEKIMQGIKHLEKTRVTGLFTEFARVLKSLCAFQQAAQLYSQVKQFCPTAQCCIRSAELIPKGDDSNIIHSNGKQIDRAASSTAL